MNKGIDFCKKCVIITITLYKVEGETKMRIVRTNDFQEGYQLGVQDGFHNSLSYTAGEYEDGFEAGYMKAMKEAGNKKFSENLKMLKRVKDLMIDERVDWHLQMKIESILLDYIETP